VIVAGVVIETVPGAAPRVAARLLHEPGLDLQGGDGDGRLAAVFTGPAGGALEALAERLMRAFPEVIGVFPTYVADDGEEPAPAAKPADDPS
jgi:nitrate reductase NapAB chaperone NapD